MRGKGEGAPVNINKARELRRNQTEAESNLWRYLRNRQLHGYKFRRQMPIGKYIVDFACVSLKMIVEIDGSQHMQNTDYDESRTEYLNKQGYKVIRFWNNEILTQIESVLEALTLTLTLSQRERECEMQD